MISRRSMALGSLMALPVLVYVVLGSYALWATGLLTRAWWLLPLCWVSTWILSRVWPASHRRIQQQRHAVLIPSHWTPRDHEAAEIVRAYQQKVDGLTPAQLTDPAFYQAEVQSMAAALSRHYHPAASEPFLSLTVPEVVAAVRLAVDDMEQWLLTSVPGSRLLTIKHWRMLQSAPKWYRRLQDTTWVASILMNPLNIARYWSSKLTLDPVTTELQTELLAAVYLRFMRQMGFYLIEMNSGRLRGGADAYRRAFRVATTRAQAITPAGSVVASAMQPVTIALVGQVSSGKSSLINVLTGTQQAAVDILPETRQVRRYQYAVGDPPVTVNLLDTPGYGESGATADQLRQIESALRDSNAVLLVMDAHSPARESDRRTMTELDAWYATQQHLKPPPMLGVLTHVDLLRPSLEWSPPYEWRQPSAAKEQSIHDAVEYVRGLFPALLKDVVPVCADGARKREWGVVEELIPALTATLNDAQATALLRAFEQDLDRDRLKTLLKQLQRSGRDLLRCWVEERILAPRTAASAPGGNRPDDAHAS